MSTPKPFKEIHLHLTKEDWEDLHIAKALSKASSYAQCLREAVRRHRNIEQDRVMRENIARKEQA